MFEKVKLKCIELYLINAFQILIIFFKYTCNIVNLKVIQIKLRSFRLFILTFGEIVKY